MKISIIVPCYNEEAALPIFYKEVKKVLMGLTSTYELIFVNDGSKDHTLPLLRQLAEEDKNVTYYSFSRNFGKEAAMYAGFCNAHGDYVAVMDADMQDPPGLLPKMIEILESGDYDSVATRRVSRQGEPPIRSWFARKFYKIINKISDSDIVDGARDFRLMKSDMVKAIVSMSERNRFSKGISFQNPIIPILILSNNNTKAPGSRNLPGALAFYTIIGSVSQTPLPAPHLRRGRRRGRA